MHGLPRSPQTRTAHEVRAGSPADRSRKFAFHPSRGVTISRYGDRHWWRSRKGQLVIGTGAILGAATCPIGLGAESLLFGYLVAAAIGLAPFSIETLMS